MEARRYFLARCENRHVAHTASTNIMDLYPDRLGATMNVENVFAVTISFNERESEVVHIATPHGSPPSGAEIDALVKPYVCSVYHESGRFEVDSVVCVQDSIDNLLAYSR